MKLWMFRCREVSQKASQSMDMTLPLGQRMAIRIHLVFCRYCLRFYRQLRLLRTLSRMDTPDPSAAEAPETLSEETKLRIKEKLRSSL